MTRNVKLSEIDPNAIVKIREMKSQNANDYVRLEKSINKFGQKYPITIRPLNAEEKTRARKGAFYGIIDGHHRFRIALQKQDEYILACIVDDITNSVQDIALAYQLNNSSIRMTPIEKGRLICDVIKDTGKGIEVIGEKYFNIKIAMAYRYVQQYKESIGKINPKKKRAPEDTFTFRKLKESINKLPRISTDIDVTDTKRCREQIKIVEDVEKQLKMLKKILKVQSETEEYNKSTTPG